MKSIVSRVAYAHIQSKFGCKVAWHFFPDFKLKVFAGVKTCELTTPKLRNTSLTKRMFNFKIWALNRKLGKARLETKTLKNYPKNKFRRQLRSQSVS